MIRPLALAVFVFIVATVPARADYIGVNFFSYAAPSNIPTTTGSVEYLGGNIAVSTSPSWTVTALTVFPDTFIPYSFIGTGALNDAAISTPYTLFILLTDRATAIAGVVEFTGMLSGPSTALTSSFTGPTVQNIVLGDTNYQVALGDYVPQTIEQGTTDGPYYYSGTIEATIVATPAVQDVPEPTSLLLAACGLPGLALAAWRRYRALSLVLVACCR